MSTRRFTSKSRHRAAWLSRAVALLLALVCVMSSISIDPACLLLTESAGEPCDDDRGPCQCPLDCASCTCVRAVPSPPLAEMSVPLPRTTTAGVPTIEGERRPISPEPSEITHVPKV